MLAQAPFDLGIQLNGEDVQLTWLAGTHESFLLYYSTNLATPTLWSLLATVPTNGTPTVSYTHAGAYASGTPYYFVAATAGHSDGDALDNTTEAWFGTSPRSADTDGDGLPDDWEIRYGLNPLRATGEDGASGDPDRDGIPNAQELTGASHPQDGSAGSAALLGFKVHRPSK
jgi:hypothetical protein